jgi:hypothetical protein
VSSRRPESELGAWLRGVLGSRTGGAAAAGLAAVATATLWVVVIHGWSDPQPAGVRAQQSDFRPPVTLRGNREYVRSRVLPSGDLLVDHWLHSSALIQRLTLSLPELPGPGGKQVQARHVTVYTDGQDVQAPTRLRRGMYVDLHTVAWSIHVSYRLSGVVVRSTPAHGRALARATTLTLGYGPDRGPRTISVTGRSVLSLACSAPTADATPSPCGRRSGHVWAVRLVQADRGDRVLARLALR